MAKGAGKELCRDVLNLGGQVLDRGSAGMGNVRGRAATSNMSAVSNPRSGGYTLWRTLSVPRKSDPLFLETGDDVRYFGPERRHGTT